MIEQRVPVQRTYRRFIPAGAPVNCPECGHATRHTPGIHTDPVRRVVLEYRACSHCDAPLAVARPMTPREVEQFCSRAEAVEEYESGASGGIGHGAV